MIGLKRLAGGPRVAVMSAPVAWFDNEHPALRACWHPVAEVGDLDGPGPFRVRLCGTDYALFRPADAASDRWSALPDRCPHRLAPLSAGQVEGERLRCGYHGWCFAADGSCIEIPALGPDATLPPTARLTPAAAVVERYGLVWMAIEDPLVALPELPEWGRDDFGLARLPAQSWAAGAAQLADNFLDVAHFPFMHAATIGDPDDRVVSDYELVRDGWVFAARHHHLARLLDGSGTIVERRMEFTCTAPHHVRLRLDYGEHGAVVLAFFHQPIDAATTGLFVLQLTTELAADPGKLAETIEFQLAVGAEDRAMLERLPTTAIPLDVGVETHTRADRITVELRRVLADLVAATAAPEVRP